MGGGQEDPEAGSGGKAMGHAPSGPLPTSEPPHMRGQDPGQYQYGTFHPPPVGYPQPAPPPGFGGGYHNQQQQPQPPYAHAEPYYAQGYQAVPGSGIVGLGVQFLLASVPLRYGWGKMGNLYSNFCGKHRASFAFVGSIRVGSVLNLSVVCAL
jgi:large subunit ribosomal protein L18Ae